MQEPRNLEAVPAYADRLLHNAVLKRDYDLGELTGRAYATGDLAVHLATYSADLSEILHDASANIRQRTLNTYELVEDLVEGSDQQTFVAAFSASSLYRAIETINNSTNRPSREAIRRGLNYRILCEAEGASSLYRAIETIDNYATTKAKPAFKSALDSRVYDEAQNASSLYRAGETISNYATLPARPYIKSSLDGRVLAEAEGASSLYRAIETAADYSSGPYIQRLIRIRLNGRVEKVALAASSSHQALETVQNYAYGEQQTPMMKKVAGIWLPQAERSLESAMSELEDIQDKIVDFNELGYFDRMFRPVSRRKLQKDLRRNETIVKHARSHVKYLDRIIQS